MEELTTPPEPETDVAVPATSTPETAEQAEQVFDLEYVTKLRQEAAEGRVKAKRADDLARQALRAITANDGRLIDPDDLAFDAAFLDDDGLLDSGKVTEAIESLISRKPHLASKRPTTTISQGARPEPTRVDLHGMLRANA